ncbi:MAG: phage tail protein, partial [Candidatus Kapaibacterium sp.]
MKKLLLLAALTIGAASVAQAQIPQIIAFQGVLSTQDSAFTGSVPLTLTLYDGSGGQVWSHTYGGVQVSRGYYAVNMDFSKDWQNGIADFSKQYWVGANINGQDLSPHVQLTASPYTMNARKADTAAAAYTALNARNADTAAVARKLVQDAPIGTIVAYAGQALGLPQEQQSGWYVCDGSSIPIASYPAYASAIGSI